VIKALPILAAIFSVAGCAAIPQKPTFLSGQWGGQGAEMLIEGGIANVQFDCAAGTIDSNLRSSGPFLAPGTFRPGQGGPVRVGQIFTSKRATYSGSVTGDQMILSVQVEDGPTVGPLTLTSGARGQLNRCL
jgi:hypothetical protein